jgi:hypothetical protein
MYFFTGDNIWGAMYETENQTIQASTVAKFDDQ